MAHAHQHLSYTAVDCFVKVDHGEVTEDLYCDTSFLANHTAVHLASEIYYNSFFVECCGGTTHTHTCPHAAACHLKNHLQRFS